MLPAATVAALPAGNYALSLTVTSWLGGTSGFAARERRGWDWALDAVLLVSSSRFPPLSPHPGTAELSFTKLAAALPVVAVVGGASQTFQVWAAGVAGLFSIPGLPPSAWELQTLCPPTHLPLSPLLPSQVANGLRAQTVIDLASVCSGEVQMQGYHCCAGWGVLNLRCAWPLIPGTSS